MNLYLIRHAIAVEAGTPGYEDDSQRPLTEKGRKKMRSIARGLIALDVKLDLIISSPYVRARETAEIVADELKPDGKIIFNEHLTPTGRFDQLINVINKKYAVENLALIGHEPGLSQMIGFLVAGSPSVALTMKKGGVCRLSVDALRFEKCAMLEWLLTPAQLVAMSDQ